MKKKLKNAWKELLSDRGSGLAMVMMAMTLLSLLATTLLNMTYTSYKIKAEDRQHKADFYVVNTAMDEIRAGLQVTASDAIATAYKELLMNYDTSLTAEKNDDIFKSKFIDAVEGTVANNYWPRIYDSGKLKNMISDRTGIEIEDSWSICEIDKTTTEIVLKDVSLKYTNTAGNEITLKTDIAISAPSLSADEWNYDELVQYRNWSTDLNE